MIVFAQYFIYAWVYSPACRRSDVSRGSAPKPTGMSAGTFPQAEVRMRTHMFRAVLFLSGCAAAPLVSLPVSAQAPVSPVHLAASHSGPEKLSAAEMSAIRAATEKYRDIKVALAEGYIRDPNNMCVTSGMEGAPRQLGAMGVH